LPENKPVKLAILWHMHQPNYREPQSDRMVMPWVRLHALKDYLDMPLLAGRYDNIRVTFNLVPSLLEQLESYVNGGTDPHLELTRIRAEDLSETQRVEVLGSFFSANPPTMIRPYPRYRELYTKAKDNLTSRVLPALFSSEELRDLQVWSNLAWIDPMFRSEEPVRSLFAKQKHYSEEDKSRLVDWQIDLIRRILPTYRELFAQGKIDVSFTPYYHPIMPLLCDTDIALEAMPKAKLPQVRFAHPEDAIKQIAMAGEMYQSIFGAPQKGMWPSEGSVSEAVARIMVEAGIEWAATDEEILVNSLRKSGQDMLKHSAYAVYEYGPGLKIFFRDHLLSDRIGFVYSGMDPDRAVADFASHIHAIREKNLDYIDDTVISVILDGENAWEYFPDDGYEFLDKFYRWLSEDPLIETVTMTKAAQVVKPTPLKSLFAGSWINHNFRVWIGHPEDNAAWELLARTRDRVEKFEKENPQFDATRLAHAWNQIYVAEGSDWCWWYGDEHRGKHNEEFDKIYRSHLIAVYDLLGLEIPFELLNPIYDSETAIRAVMPDDMITPVIDGRVTHFYEWTGAGLYDSRKVGGAMHRVDRIVNAIYFSYDYDNLYIRLDFDTKKSIELIKGLKCRLTLFTPEPKHLLLDIGRKKKTDDTPASVDYAFAEVLEIAIERSFVFDTGFGTVGFTVMLMDNDTELEVWPETDAITLDIPDRGKEMFWPE